MIGLSGLITPSLEEMAHVAGEMKREGFTIPLLIGGATTSKAHTAVKIAPAYPAGVLHVLDASRAVGVVGQLKNAAERGPFIEANRHEQEKLREHHRAEAAGRPLLAWRRRVAVGRRSTGRPTSRRGPLHGSASSTPGRWKTCCRSSTGRPFFHTWELKGTYPRIFENPTWGSKARELFDDARRMLDRFVAERRLTAQGVMGFFPPTPKATTSSSTRTRRGVACSPTFRTLRPAGGQAGGPARAGTRRLRAPRETGRAGLPGAFAVTTGWRLDAVVAEFERDHDDYNAIMAKALADRLAEALAEALHKRAARSGGTAVVRTSRPRS
jgi:5-methyltetrahydrofolate--homocysteine methyltransferase